MNVIGLTGGIGSGKTTVLKMFQELGIPVYIADIEAKKLMQTNKSLKKELITHFGELTFKNNQLNTTYLAEIVFSDINKLKLINQLVHPKVIEHFKQFKNQHQSSYIVFENAILFENNFDNLCDYIITITAPLIERIKRVKLRDGIDEKQILNRMQHQWPDEKKIKNSHFIIENTNLNQTQNQVLAIHKQLLNNIGNNKKKFDNLK